MATAYRAPIDPPEIDIDDWRKPAEGGESPWFRKEREYLESLAAQARAIAKAEGRADPVVGEVVRWQRGDGYAQYMVWRAKPLQLIHIATGDAWGVEDALIRGLRLTDIRQMVEREKRLDALFGRK